MSRKILPFALVLVGLCLFASESVFSQQGDRYLLAYNYIFKSKALDDFRDEVRRSEGIIVRWLAMSDSVIENDPFPFLCAMLKRKTKNEDKCSDLIGRDKLATYDSIVAQHRGYTFCPETMTLKVIRTGKRRVFDLSFSDFYKNTITASVRFKKSDGTNRAIDKTIMFYFVFTSNGKIKNVFTAETQNYHL